MKKNETINYFIVKTLIEKVGGTRTVRKVLDIMSEKYSKTKGEKVAEVMRKISNFKVEGTVEILIDKFEEMITKTERLRLAENLKYALSLQFLERLETNGKINAGEKLRLKDVIEDANGEPKVGDHVQMLKRELRRIKVVENRDEPFSKENKTFYMRNDENRSRYNNWKNSMESQGYVRSKSNPKFFRTQSKNNYVRDNS